MKLDYAADIALYGDHNTIHFVVNTDELICGYFRVEQWEGEGVS